MSGITREQRLWNLLDGLSHDACIDAESAAEDLRAAGLDPDKIGAQGQRFVMSLQHKIRLSIAKANRQSQEEALSELRKRATRHLREFGGQAKDILRKVLTDRPEFEVSFRKIETLAPEDAVEILSEIELLDLLAEERDNIVNEENGN